MIALVCTCGHRLGAHDHHRAGSDCSRCTCDRWHWRWAHLADWRGWRRYQRIVASAEVVELKR